MLPTWYIKSPNNSEVEAQKLISQYETVPNRKKGSNWQIK